MVELFCAERSIGKEMRSNKRRGIRNRINQKCVVNQQFEES